MSVSFMCLISVFRMCFCGRTWPHDTTQHHATNWYVKKDQWQENRAYLSIPKPFLIDMICWLVLWWKKHGLILAKISNIPSKPMIFYSKYHQMCARGQRTQQYLLFCHLFENKYCLHIYIYIHTNENRFFICRHQLQQSYFNWSPSWRVNKMVGNSNSANAGLQNEIRFTSWWDTYSQWHGHDISTARPRTSHNKPQAQPS